MRTVSQATKHTLFASRTKAISGLDLLISKSLDSSIRENLGESAVRKIEQKLSEKYGTNLAQVTEDLAKLDSVLKELFGQEAERVMRQFLENITTRQDSDSKNAYWVTIQDISLAKLILAVLGDEDMKSILDSALGKPKTFMEILQVTKLPPSSCYRKVCSLVESGLLIDVSSDTNSDEKRKVKYKSIFESISIKIEKNKIIVEILLTKESIEKSSAIEAIKFR
jgi:hypothetical protein